MREEEEFLHLHVLVEEVEEELVATLVFLLDFGVFEVGAISHFIISIRSNHLSREEKDRHLPSSHPSVDLGVKGLDDVLDLQFLPVSCHGFFIFVLRREESDWNGDF
jgi:hypothetical protein